MELRVTEKKDIPQLKALWREVFDKEGIYTELFFKHRYETTEGIGLFDGEKLLSALYLMPCTFKIKDKEYSLSYIFAVATFQKERCRGYSGRVLNFAHEYLKNKGTDCVCLVPAEESLFKFYERNGYETAFYADFKEFKAENGNRKLLEKCSLTDFLSLRSDYFNKTAGYMCWDKSALEFCEIDNNYSHGEILSFPKISEGYAVCSYSDEEVLIKEFICPDEKRQEVINAVGAYFNKKKVTVRDVPKDETARPFGMAHPLSDKFKKEYKKDLYALSLPMD